jgi:TPR repeat protein
LKEAIRLYRLAAQHLQADAQYSLGVCYADGHIRATEEPFEGVNMEAEAFKWYKLAAENGQPDAMYNLGVCYAHGVTGAVEANEQESVKWVTQAANSGVAFAQYNLSVRYDRGIGLPQSKELSQYWLKLASTQGYDGTDFLITN